MPYEGALAIVSIFIIAPSIVFGFLLLSKRGRNQVELAKYRLGEAELALEREKLRVEALREENRKLDRLIEHRMEAP